MRIRPSDAFTFLPLVAGVLALALVSSGSPAWGGAMLIVAACADRLDVRVARKLGRESPFGVHLDSLVDICSFGFAPVAIAILIAGAPAWLVVAGILYLGASVYLLASGMKGLPLAVYGALFSLTLIAPSVWIFVAFFAVAAVLIVTLKR